MKNFHVLIHVHTCMCANKNVCAKFFLHVHALSNSVRDVNLRANGRVLSRM